MISVIGILLGLAVAGVFYYLGKINDQKYNFVSSIAKQVNLYKTEASAQNERIKKFFEAFNKMDDAQKFFRGEEIRQIMTQVSNMISYNKIYLAYEPM